MRHRLASPASTIEQAVGDLVVLHATEAATVYLSTRARLGSFDAAELERKLYDERSLLRVLAMRRTLFVTPVVGLPVIHAACSRALAEREHRASVQRIEKAGIADDGDDWLGRVKAAALAALADRGEATAAELSAAVPELRRQIPHGVGTNWEGSTSVGSLVLTVLSAEARIARGRPRGTWLSNQYRWVPMERWLPDGVADFDLPTVDAQADLALAWLASFGPGTMRDLKWWTGWTMADTRRAIAAVDAVEVELEAGGTGFVLAGDLEPIGRPDPWVALLPALDSTVMGWAERDWYVGDHAPTVFDSAGNASPTVWCDGRVVGAWAVREDGEVVCRLFDDIGSEATSAVMAKAESLSDWLSDRARPRFRTRLRL
ncbi:MAG: winged helix DNA-binding domain-containing protein [Acidimicrobiia bacterium]